MRSIPLVVLGGFRAGRRWCDNREIFACDAYMDHARDWSAVGVSREHVSWERSPDPDVWYRYPWHLGGKQW